MNDEAPSDVPSEPDPGSSLVDRLATRLSELRAQLVAILPEGEEALRNAQEAAEEARERQERIVALERLLEAARRQEEGLTTEIVRHQSTIEELRTRAEALTAMVARVPEFERGRAAAEARATEAEHRADRVAAELASVREDLRRARARIADLEADLSATAAEVTAAATARADAQRLAMQRDEARERAETERRMAAADRFRAEEAERRLAELEARTGGASVPDVAAEPEVAAEPDVRDENGPEGGSDLPPERPSFPPLERERGPWFRDRPDIVDVTDPPGDEDVDPLIPNEPRYWS